MSYVVATDQRGAESFIGFCVFGNIIFGAFMGVDMIRDIWSVQEHLNPLARILLWIVHTIYYPAIVTPSIWTFFYTTLDLYWLLCVAIIAFYSYFILDLYVTLFQIARAKKYGIMFFCTLFVPLAIGAYLYKYETIFKSEYGKKYPITIETMPDKIDALGYLDYRSLDKLKYIRGMMLKDPQRFGNFNINVPRTEKKLDIYIREHKLPANISDEDLARDISNNYKKQVMSFQQCLNKNGYSVGAVDGILGKKTENMIIKIVKKAPYNFKNRMPTREYRPRNDGMYSRQKAVTINHAQTLGFYLKGCNFKYKEIISL